VCLLDNTTKENYSVSFNVIYNYLNFLAKKSNVIKRHRMEIT